MVKENPETISSLQVPGEKFENSLFLTEASNSEEYDEESTQCY